jgi:GNAT superfamily N-acetyltransferase
MDKEQIIALYTQDQRIEVEYPTLRREAAGEVVRHVNKDTDGEGAVLYTRLDESEVEKTIREQIAYYQGIGQGFEWKVYDYDSPPDLKERLAAQGFEVEDQDAIMVLDLEEAPEALFRPASPKVTRISEPEGIEDVVALENEVWDDDYSDLGRSLAYLLANYPHVLSVYVAYVEGIAASTGWVIFSDGSVFGSLWGGSTLSQYRGQGLYTALLATRAQEAREREVRYLTVDASPMSRPILEKFGFQVIAHAYACKKKFG